MSLCREAGVVAGQPRVERPAAHRARRGASPRVPARKEVGARQRETEQRPARHGHGAAAGGPRHGPPRARRLQKTRHVIGVTTGAVRYEQALGEEPPRPVATASKPPRRRQQRSLGHDDSDALQGTRGGAGHGDEAEHQVGRVLLRRAAAGAGGRARADERGAVPVRRRGEGAGAAAGGPGAARGDGRPGGGGGQLPQPGHGVLRRGAQQEAFHEGRATGHRQDTSPRFHLRRRGVVFLYTANWRSSLSSLLLLSDTTLFFPFSDCRGKRVVH
jgi:hypothetical protein